jgi:hypothetical protein
LVVAFAHRAGDVDFKPGTSHTAASRTAESPLLSRALLPPHAAKGIIVGTDCPKRFGYCVTSRSRRLAFRGTIVSLPLPCAVLSYGSIHKGPRRAAL